MEAPLGKAMAAASSCFFKLSGMVLLSRSVRSDGLQANPNNSPERCGVANVSGLDFNVGRKRTGNVVGSCGSQRLQSVGAVLATRPLGTVPKGSPVIV